MMTIITWFLDKFGLAGVLVAGLLVFYEGLPGSTTSRRCSASCRASARRSTTSLKAASVGPTSVAG